MQKLKEKIKEKKLRTTKIARETAKKIQWWKKENKNELII